MLDRKFMRFCKIAFLALFVGGCQSLGLPFDFPSEYQNRNVTYPVNWEKRQDSDPRRYVQINERVRMSFSLYTNAHYSTHPSVSPILKTEDISVVLYFARCSRNRYMKGFDGCREEGDPEFSHAPDVNLETEEIVWDRKILVRDLKRDALLTFQLKGEPVKGEPSSCELKKFCRVSIDFMSETYRPEIEINLGVVYVRGKPIETPTIRFRWQEAYRGVL